MVLSMARPTTRKTSRNALFQRRVPGDVLPKIRGKSFHFSLPIGLPDAPPVIISAKAGEHLKFSLQTGDASLITLRHSAALSQFEAIVKAQREGPVSLTRKQVVALAGEIFLNALGDESPLGKEASPSGKWFGSRGRSF
jgi:hypothetical protein